MVSSGTDSSPALSALLDPAALAKISKMEFVARQIMDGYVQGMHRAPHLGFALDFAQHRQYVPGDDTKRIDWRVYAKADRFYIKQYEVSTTLRATIVLDASGSMAYRGVGDPLTKFRSAQYIAACLSYLILNQNDAAGLITFDNKIRQSIPPRCTPSHLLALCGVLDATETGGESAIAPLLHEVAERIKKRGIIIVLSDLFDDATKLIEALHHLRYKRHEVLLMQVMAEDELTFPFRQWSLFENLEKQVHRLKLDPAVIRADYLHRVAGHLKAIRDGASKLNVSHVLLNTGKPFAEALMMYLAERMGWK